MPALSASTVLRWAMEIEENGESFYKAVAAQSTNRDVKLLFEDLAYQEARHFRTFSRMLERVPEAELPDSDYEGYRNYLNTALSNALFAGPDKGMKMAQAAGNEEAALKAAIAFEKDTLLFFYDVRDMVPPMHKDSISALIQEETNHVRQLTRVLNEGPWVA
jgi:rubrerythrin